MKRLAFALAFALLAVCAYAADLTGKWTGQMAGMGGDPMNLTFVFKQDGAKLTGTVESPMGAPMEFKDGKVDGNKFSFAVNAEGGMNVKHEGTINGDEIKMSAKFEGGEISPMELTLKRQK
jgi:hypothetical protein